MLSPLSLKVLGFCCFQELSALREIKAHSLRTTPFQKKKKRIDMDVLGMCLSYVKRYFQEHEFSAFLIVAQITQILLFLGMPILERSNITV